MAEAGTSPDSSVRALLQESYKEVLDAVKHQDDKIGRLFTGIAFLTAAALAMANLGGAAFLEQRFKDWPSVPPAMLSLAAYLLLVFLAVTILVGSMGTPLRVPGLKATPPDLAVPWVGGLQASQIYFGEISTVGLLEWNEKWAATKEELELESARSLVGETHNLAVRTQFKYGRMNEAIALFNLALLFLAVTVILGVAAASLEFKKGPQIAPPGLPGRAHAALALVVAAFVFLQLFNQVRYTRQTMDEVDGARLLGPFEHVWVLAAAAWVFLLGWRGGSGCLIWLVGALGIACLAIAVILRAEKLELKRLRRTLIPPCAVGVTLTVVSSFSPTGSPVDIYCALIAAGALTIVAVISPTLDMRKRVARYRERMSVRPTTRPS